VMDLINAQALKTYTASIFVIDEADMTLDMGFLTEVDKIASTFDKKVQMLVFSATIPQKLQPFLKKYLNHPVMEKIATKTVISDTIDNWVFSTKGRGNNGAILEILQTLNPYLAMIFANTKDRADELHSFLTNNGFKVAKIHGGVPPRERKRIMKAVQNLDYQYVVATDLAARGIDIEGVSHIINDGIPRDLEFFVHRVGRTGRNGMGGTAITLYQPSDDAAILELEKTGIKFTPKVIKDGEIVDSYDRDRRKKREKSREALDITMIGLVKKKKKHIKPAYKKKIGWEIDKQKTAKKRIEGRAQGRSERKAKRQSF
ncbi:MAG: DEAD/DEAH box helicase, partial [Lactococcus sp.]|nr:DEAD/DEAH box helicase [Lactococcus sp.]